MQKRKIFLFALILITTLNQGCFSDMDEVWVVTDPVQCLGNPWEIDWLEKHEKDNSAWSELSPEEKVDVFVEYYSEFGIEIKSVQKSFLEEDVCAACSCPRGDRFHCLIDKQDLDEMLELGFSLE